MTGLTVGLAVAFLLIAALWWFLPTPSCIDMSEAVGRPIEACGDQSQRMWSGQSYRLGEFVLAVPALTGGGLVAILVGLALTKSIEGLAVGVSDQLDESFGVNDE